MELPQAFREKMKSLLGEEYGAFLESYDREREQGLRLNLLKTDRERFEKETEFSLTPIPWAEEGYYYKAQDRPGRHPYHEAGVYYIQEPSAMAVVSLLDPQPGERVLDLCAAPGGKTSHIASRLQGQGFLLSNEIHPARARILSQNVERMGIGNAAVFNEDSARLSAAFPGYFDRIAVDAPCSGEGMFRKDEGARAEWSPANVRLCAERQAEILENAAAMLKPGGTMAYSTCTFSPEEDEQAVETFLKAHPEFKIKKVKKYPGLSDGMPQWALEARQELSDTVRIWPQRTGGEGHFIAVLKKEGQADRERKRRCPVYAKDRKLFEYWENFLRENLSAGKTGRGALLSPGRREEFMLFGEQLYLLPPELPAFDGLRVLRPGLHLGTLKKNRFEPSYALALWMREEDAAGFCRLFPGSPAMGAYLRGEALPLSAISEKEAAAVRIPPERKKGWILMSTGTEKTGYSIGWAKLAGGILKNHYPKGLRIQGYGE